MYELMVEVEELSLQVDLLVFSLRGLARRERTTPRRRSGGYETRY